jgi:hypothetical protein
VCGRLKGAQAVGERVDIFLLFHKRLWGPLHSAKPTILYSALLICWPPEV